ncbi:hypothetical protein, partial [Azospirillum sp.]|uniref:hypothetical protein n=1 Tax=Azospirillum sp. TaxID=34012 RepID=UPI003D71B3FD
DRLREWREDMRAVNDAGREVERWEDPDEHGPFWTEKPPTLRIEFRHKYEWQNDRIDQAEENRHWFSGSDRLAVDVPDGWELWFRVLKLVGEPWHRPNDIFKASVRRELLEALEGRLSGDGNEAADTLYRISGDYHVSESWSHQALNLMAALYRWAGLVLDGEEYRIAKAKADALAEHRKIVAMLDRRMPDNRYDGYSRAPGVVPFNRLVGPEVRNAA